MSYAHKAEFVVCRQRVYTLTRNPNKGDILWKLRSNPKVRRNSTQPSTSTRRTIAFQVEMVTFVSSVEHEYNKQPVLCHCIQIEFVVCARVVVGCGGCLSHIVPNAKESRRGLARASILTNIICVRLHKKAPYRIAGWRFLYFACCSV